MEVTQENWGELRSKIEGGRRGKRTRYEDGTIELPVDNMLYQFSPTVCSYLKGLRGDDRLSPNLREQLS